MKCLITELVHPSGVDILKQHYDVTLAYGKSLDEVKAMVKDYEILIVRSDTPVQKDMIDAGVKLKVIGMAGIGLNHIDTKYAEEKGFRIEFIHATAVFRNSDKLKNSDIIIFDTSYNSHSAYYKLKSHGLKIYRISTSNLDKIKKFSE